MFSIDGKILPCTKKSQILHTIGKSVPEGSMPKRSLIGNTYEKSLNAVIIDAMALFNKIQITPQMKTNSEIKTAFKNPLLQKASHFDDMRLVFGRYLNSSFEEQYREKRTSGRQIKYVIRDSTPLESITLEDFLSHIETSDLTTNLAEYCVKELKKTEKVCRCLSNILCDQHGKLSPRS